jgi:hypothetical protein
VVTGGSFPKKMLEGPAEDCCLSGFTLPRGVAYDELHTKLCLISAGSDVDWMRDGPNRPKRYGASGPREAV